MGDFIQGYKDKVADLLETEERLFFKFYHEDYKLQRGKKNWENQFRKYLSKERYLSLELSYGAGGMIAAASKDFELAAGVEIHDASGFVAEVLRLNDVNNFVLKDGDGHLIPFEDNCADFIYSWTAFQHYGSLDVIVSYLNETRRVLKSTGRAVYYFARMRQKGVVTEEMWRQAVGEECEHPDGFWVNKDAKTNQTNITISMWLMEEMANIAGLKVVDRFYSGNPKRVGGQHGVMLCQN